MRFTLRLFGIAIVSFEKEELVYEEIEEDEEQAPYGFAR